MGVGAGGILVSGGFGDKGVIEGRILVAKYACENRVLYLGICLGMQVVVIEYARPVLGVQDANSTKFDLKTENPCHIYARGVENAYGWKYETRSRRTHFQVKDSKSAKLPCRKFSI